MKLGYVNMGYKGNHCRYLLPILLFFSFCLILNAADRGIQCYGQYIGSDSAACFDLLYVVNGNRACRDIINRQSIIYDGTVPVLKKIVRMLPSPNDRNLKRQLRQLQKGAFYCLQLDRLASLDNGEGSALPPLIAKEIAFLKVGDLKKQRMGDARGGSRNVVVSRSGWLFHGHKSFIRHYSNRDRWSDTQLSELLSQLHAIHRTLERQEIFFVLVSAPTKFSIYPEYFPKKLIVPRSQHNRHYQLMNLLEMDGRIPVLRLHDALIEAKSHCQQEFGHPFLYSRMDHHWNSFGAYVAYRAIIKRLKGDGFLDLEIIPLGQFKRFDDRHADNLLLAQSGLLELNEALPFYGIEAGKKRGKRYRLLLIHDSFGYYLKPFLSASFKAVEFVYANRGHRITRDLLARFKPDIVMIVQLESLMGRLLKYQIEK